MAVPFTIVEQQHEWQFQPNGQRTGQWIVTFQTESGVTHQVTIADESYYPEVVAAEIAAEAAKIEAVQNLTQGEPAQRRPGNL